MRGRSASRIHAVTRASGRSRTTDHCSVSVDGGTGSNHMPMAPSAVAKDSNDSVMAPIGDIPHPVTPGRRQVRAGSDYRRHLARECSADGRRDDARDATDLAHERGDGRSTSTTARSYLVTARRRSTTASTCRQMSRTWPLTARSERRRLESNPRTLPSSKGPVWMIEVMRDV